MKYEVKKYLKKYTDSVTTCQNCYPCMSENGFGSGTFKGRFRWYDFC